MSKLLPYILLTFLLCSCIVRAPELNHEKAPKNAKELISKVISKNKTSEWLRLQGKIKLIKGEQITTPPLNINVKLRKDSLIWASLKAPFVGVELFRIMFTKDSVYYLNPTKKTFFIKPITHISDILKTEISFDEIQEIVTANPRVLKKEYEFHKNKNTFELNSSEGFYKISADSYRILEARIIDNTWGKTEVTYECSSFINKNEFIFPKQFSIKVLASLYHFEAQVDYSKIIFNEKQKIPFKIPSSYVEAE